MEKLCLFCEHWYFEGGSPGYSEYTPGSDAIIGCNKMHWRKDTKSKMQVTIVDIYNQDSFRTMLEKALTCPDYKQVELPANV